MRPMKTTDELFTVTHLRLAVAQGVYVTDF